MNSKDDGSINQLFSIVYGGMALILLFITFSPCCANGLAAIPPLLILVGVLSFLSAEYYYRDRGDSLEARLPSKFQYSKFSGIKKATIIGAVGLALLAYLGLLQIMMQVVASWH